ncbi:hypothetical protein Tco_0557910 [Tanacetum coccineum]
MVESFGYLDVAVCNDPGDLRKEEDESTARNEMEIDLALLCVRNVSTGVDRLKGLCQWACPNDPWKYHRGQGLNNVGGSDWL